MENINFLTDDWKKIPQNIRFVLMGGIVLILNTWLLDHWGIKEPYKFWFWDIRAIGYDIGLTLIILSFVLLITKQFYYFGRIAFFRIKYPLNKLNDTFYLVWFNGKLILFDIKEKNIFMSIPGKQPLTYFLLARERNYRLILHQIANLMFPLVL